MLFAVGGRRKRLRGLLQPPDLSMKRYSVVKHEAAGAAGRPAGTARLETGWKRARTAGRAISFSSGAASGQEHRVPLGENV